MHRPPASPISPPHPFPITYPLLFLSNQALFSPAVQAGMLSVDVGAARIIASLRRPVPALCEYTRIQSILLASPYHPAYFSPLTRCPRKATPTRLFPPLLTLCSHPRHPCHSAHSDSTSHAYLPSDPRILHRRVCLWIPFVPLPPPPPPFLASCPVNGISPPLLTTLALPSHETFHSLNGAYLRAIGTKAFFLRRRA